MGSSNQSDMVLELLGGEDIRFCADVFFIWLVSDRPWGDLQAKLPGNVCDANSRNGMVAISRFTPPLVDNLIQLNMSNKT